MDLQRKIFRQMAVVLTLLCVLLIGGLVAFGVREHRTLTREAYLTRGAVLAEELRRLILWDDHFAVRRLLTTEAASVGPTRYAFVTLAGEPYASSFEHGVPTALATHARNDAEIGGYCEVRDEKGALYYQLHVAVAGTQAVLHLGLLRSGIDRDMLPLLVWIGLLTLGAVIVSVVAAAAVARRTTLDLTLLSKALLRYTHAGARNVVPRPESSTEAADLVRSFDRLVTERKHVEDELRRQKDFLDDILTSLTHPLYVVNAKSCHVEMANRAARDIGIVPGSVCHASTHHSDVPCFEVGLPCPLATVVETKAACILTHAHFDAHGEPRQMEVHGYPLMNEAGSVTQMIEYTVDISERLRVEAQLRQAQKMEAVGTMAGGVAHDFRNLLQVIQGYTELLRADPRLSDSVQRDLGAVSEAASQAAELTKQLLTFSRRGSSDRRPIDLNSVLRRSLTFLSRTLPKMVCIELDLGPDLEPVFADPAQLEQILLNLALNASAAMPDGGALAISTEPTLVTPGEEAAARGLRPGRYALLQVRDTGCGMDDATQARVFEPFFTTKMAGRGSGLGLAMVHGIVKGHDGHVSCSSELGKGTCFTIYLPMHQGDVAAEEKPKSGATPRGTETVLVVEDESPIRSLAENALGTLGYTTVPAASGEEALEIFERQGEGIALVLLDLSMPGMGGERCLEELRRRRPDVSVLVLSGYSGQEQQDRLVALGARGFLTKPYHLHELALAVRRVLDAYPWRQRAPRVVGEG